MYYGGAQKRPDGQYGRPIRNHAGKVIGVVGEGNRKDVRNAVEAAHKAAPGYEHIFYSFWSSHRLWKYVLELYNIKSSRL